MQRQRWFSPKMDDRFQGATTLLPTSLHTESLEAGEVDKVGGNLTRCDVGMRWVSIAGGGRGSPLQWDTLLSLEGQRSVPWKRTTGTVINCLLFCLEISVTTSCRSSEPAFSLEVQLSY